MYIESKTLIKYGDFFLSLQLNETIISHISNMELNFCGENGRVQAVVQDVRTNKVLRVAGVANRTV